MCSGSKAGSYLRFMYFVSLNSRLESYKEEEKEDCGLGPEVWCFVFDVCCVLCVVCCVLCAVCCVSCVVCCVLCVVCGVWCVVCCVVCVVCDPPSD